MTRFLPKMLFSLSCIFALGTTTHAQPLHLANPLGQQTALHRVTFEAIDNSGLFWNKEVAACDNAGVLDRVRALFDYQVHNVPQLPNVAITGFRNIHQNRYLPAGDVSSPARRYCGATADFSDGRSRVVFYLIEDEGGFASVGDGVKFCVPGFDRWRVYNGNCRLID